MTSKQQRDQQAKEPTDQQVNNLVRGAASRGETINADIVPAENRAINGLLRQMMGRSDGDQNEQNNE